MRIRTSFILGALLPLLSAATPAHASLQTYQPADFVLGQVSSPGTVYLQQPLGIAVDPATGKVFVADTDHYRVLRYGSSQTLANGAAPEAVLGQPNFSTMIYGHGADKVGAPTGLAITTGGHLWVSDFYASRVVRFDNAATRPSGGVADGVLGQTDFLGTSFTLSASGLFEPGDLTASGAALYVVDKYFRVLRFNNAAQKPNGAAADAVFGEPDFVTSAPGLSASKFSGVSGVAVEPAAGAVPARLWVADYSNNRVLGFDGADNVTGAAGAATHVLGQTDFVSSAFGTTASTLYRAQGLAILSTPFGSSLYVGDAFNHRLLRFDNPATKPNGAAANGVVGQSSFTNSDPTGPIYSLAQMTAGPAGALWMAGASNNLALRFNQSSPQPTGGTYDLLLGGGGTKPAEVPLSGDGMAMDPASGKVFVSDRANNQVLRFASYDSLNARSTPETYFGTGTGNAYANSFVGPLGITIDAAGRLWVADAGNHRVLRFDNAANSGGAPNADGLLGQTDFALSSTGATATQMNHPAGVVADGTRLWVMDTDNNRVLRFDNAATKAKGAPADGVLGQPNFTTVLLGTSATAMIRPAAAAAAAHGRLWVLDGGNNRVLRFDDAATKTNGAAANGVLGQPNFTTKTAGSTAAKLNAFRGSVVVDRTGRLYVGEEANNRIVWFNRAALKTNGANADGLLGQPSFGPTTAGFDEHHLGNVYGLCLDPDAGLWAIDSANQRVLRFRSTIPSIDIFGLNASKQAYVQFSTVGGDLYEVVSSSDMKVWVDDSPALLGIGNVLYWTDTSPKQTKRFYRVVELPQ